MSRLTRVTEFKTAIKLKIHIKIVFSVCWNITDCINLVFNPLTRSDDCNFGKYLFVFFFPKNQYHIMSWWRWCWCWGWFTPPEHQVERLKRTHLRCVLWSVTLFQLTMMLPCAFKKHHSVSAGTSNVDEILCKLVADGERSSLEEFKASTWNPAFTAHPENPEAHKLCFLYMCHL